MCDLLNKLLKYFLVIVLIVLLSCNDNSVEPIAKNNHVFAIYYLKDTTLKAWDVWEKDLNSFFLEDKPWLTENDIDFYDWSSHCIYLKKNKSNFFPKEKNPLHPEQEPTIYQYLIKQHGKPWVVVANGTRCYWGCLDSGLWDIPPIASIDLVSIDFYPEDILGIAQWAYVFYHFDIKDNETVKKALKEKGLLHEGIVASFESHESIKVINGDTTTIEYTLNIKNNDPDNLYIIDPYKTKSEYWYGMSLAPILINTQTDKQYSPKLAKQEAATWDKAWYYLLKSGETIKRTIRCKGYEYMPPGEYVIQTYYPSYIRINKNERITPEGRYWIGGKLTDTLRIKIK